VRKVTCPCEQTFSVEIPEKIDLDRNPENYDKLIEGNLLSCVCPTCEAVLNLDLALTVSWPSKNTIIHMIPEIERLALVSGKLSVKKNSSYVVGYAELVDRIIVLKENLEPVVIESIKYHLLQKAKESRTKTTPIVFFEKINESGELEFHIHGIRENEVAVTRVPKHLYNSIKEDYIKNPDKEDYTALCNGSYCSVRNVLIEDSPNA